MKTRNVIAALSLVGILSFTLGFAPRQDSVPGRAPTPEQTSATFAVDGVHSSTVFKIMHMGVANFYGRFNALAGEYTLDEADPSKSRFAFEVKADSIDTGNKNRDGHLKSADFFNVEEYPLLTFKSTKVERKSDNKLSVTGDFSMHGVTRPITIDMTVFTAKQTRQGVKGGLDTTFTIKRSDFEMDTYIAEGGLGDEVTIMVAVEGARK